MTSPMKQAHPPAVSPEKQVLKKKSGFFQNHSPFRRKSTKNTAPPANRNTWHAAKDTGSPRRPGLFNQDSHDEAQNFDPIDANASLALGVGQNVLPVTAQESPRRRAPQQAQEVDESDPIAQALAELKGVTLGNGKESLSRMSADHYHGIATPAPGAQGSAARSGPAPSGREAPPSYNQPPPSRLGVPPPAVTAKAMKQASQKVADQTRNVFGDRSRGGSTGYGNSPSRSSADIPRAASPAVPRSASPQPPRNDSRRMDHRSVSPNPHGSYQSRNGSQASMNRGSAQGFYRGASPNDASPSSYSQYGRPKSVYGQSSGGDMSVQLAPTGEEGYGSQRGRGGSQAMGLYEGNSRPRSKSVADPSRQYTRDGRPILHFGK